MIETDPAGAALTVNGEPIGTSPASAKVAVGKVQISADWPDGRHAQQAVNVTAAGAIVKLAAPPPSARKKGKAAAASPAQPPPPPPPPPASAAPSAPPEPADSSTAPAEAAPETAPPPTAPAPTAPPPTAPPPSRTSSTSRFGQSYHYPGRFQVGFHPLGAQVAFDGLSPGGYKFAADFAGHLRDVGKLGLWLGGGFNYTLGTYTYAFGNHDVQLWAFVMMTFEQLLKIPLVPFARAGLAGDILVYSPNGGGGTGGAFGLRFGGGMHFYVLPQLGVGFETNFTLGGGSYPPLPGCGAIRLGMLQGCSAFYGNWDFMFGGRFAF